MAATYKPPTIKSRWFPEFFEKLPSAEGKVVVITGTTSGTGYVAALSSAKKGAHVVVLNRDSERAQKSLQQLQDAAPGATIEWVKCDLQDFASVKAAAKELIEKFGDREHGIDVLCNNAGVMALEDKATKDGYDIQIQTNHLSHFLLTKELFPLIKKSPDGRIVNHSSFMRLLPPYRFKSKYFLQKGGKLGGNGTNNLFGGRWKRYHQSKLANSLFTLELKHKLNKSGIKNVRTFCAHPGLAATELQTTTTNDKGMDAASTTALMSSSQSPEDGAMGILRGMLSDDVKNGALYGPYSFFTGKAVSLRHGIFSTGSAAHALWRQSEKACGKFEL